jgi:hypothetical protein
VPVILVLGVGAVQRAPAFVLFRPWCPLYSDKSVNRVAVHKSVDDLCNTVDSLCTAREMLGIVRASRIYSRAVTWVNAIHTLCMNRTLKLSTHHTAMDHN